MQYFSEEWYNKYYRQINIDINNYENYFFELELTYKEAAEWQEKEFAKIPDDFPLKKYDLHDTIVRNVEYDGNTLIMHLDSNNCFCTIEKLVFKGVDSSPKYILDVQDIYLDWFQTEIQLNNGKYKIGILFRCFETQNGNNIMPIVVEIDADDVCIVKEI